MGTAGGLDQPLELAEIGGKVGIVGADRADDVELAAVVGFANLTARGNTAMGITSQGFSKVCALPLARASAEYVATA